VTVNGKVVREPGTRAVWGEDRIRLNGEEVRKPAGRIYLLLNKPFGVVSSLKDPEGRPVVTDLVKDAGERVYPVGRLDFDTMGLLILTNDGDLAFRLAHPRFHVPKTYKATVEGSLTNQALESLRDGVYLEDGLSGPAKVTVIRQGSDRSILRLTVTRGRSRLVRRMLEAVDAKVIHLLRTGFGMLELGDLKVGEYRSLETEEVDALKKMVGLQGERSEVGSRKSEI
jgi:23S rRNA pseudouridine2605 synthase